MIVDWLAARGAGESVVQYKLRDWLFSRQRYWGEPFPVAYVAEGETDGGPSIPRALPDADLPVLLPDVEDYSPKSFAPDDRDSSPESPLARATEWVAFDADLASDPEHGWTEYLRETNTMPQWAGSCWYYLRYLDPHNNERFVDPEVERYWLGPKGPGDPGGVDLYVGGVEHAVLHLLYARFWHKVLFDLGHVSLRRSRSAGCSTRATSRPGPTPTRAASTCRPRRWRVTRRPDSRGTASPCARSTGRWASRCATW